MRIKRKEVWNEPSKFRLSLVALIDVVLFLLLYFMIAGTLSPPDGTLSSALRSEGAGKGGARDLSPQIVTVDADASGRAVFRLGPRAFPDRAALAEVIKGLPKEGGIFVKVSGRVPVEAGAAALQACKDAGFTRITYVPAS
jgi:biopolymer transport protein ExbD